MKSHSAPVWLPVLLLVLCVATGLLTYRQYRVTAERDAVLARLEAENRDLRTRLTGLGSAPPPVSQAPQQTPSRGDADSDARVEAEVAARLESVRMMSQLRDQLAAAKTSIDELQNRVLELEAASGKYSEENKRLVAAEADLRENLASANRIVEAMQTELKGKTSRLLMLETAARRTSDEMQAANDKIAQFTKWARDLEDLNRRREVHLTNLTRRYRDLTDQMRTVALRLDSPQETPRPQPMDLSRIQNAIQLAEDDLRQLNGLNSQASRLSRQIRN